MKRPGMWLALCLLAVGIVLLGAACGSSSSGGSAGGVSSSAANGASTPHIQGGTIKAALHGGIDFLDPALAYYQISWQIEYVTCVQLIGYPDKPAPEGYQLVPEAASSMPTVSSDGKTVTFTVPAGKYKFNTGEPVTAQTFADALLRDLNPKQVSPFVSFVGSSIEGASGWDGKGTIPGVEVQGDKLILHLTQPNGTIVAEMATPFMCAIPHNLPVNSKGVTSIAGAGPYYVASYSPNQSIVLKRNPNYTGPRPHTVDEIDYTQLSIDQNQGILSTKNGSIDYCPDCATAAQSLNLYQQYGDGSPAAQSGKQSFFISPVIEINYYALNTANAAFKNALVRQAVNYAIDRAAHTKQLGYKAGLPTDKYLPPQVPGASVEQNIYPNTADATKAKALMDQAKQQGVKTPITALVYSTQGCDQCTNRMAILKQELAPLGINIKVKYYERAVQFQEEGVKGTPNDIADEGWLADFPDPYDFLNILLSGDSILPKNGDNFAYFDNPDFNKRMNDAAKLTGNARANTYGQIATDMARDQAPWAAWSNQTNYDFFSSRVGCQLWEPSYGMDLATLCIRK
ncbi:MAG TPA: ABC transporter substrate-binding protein [Gaiellales bacterium]|jgi:peptide/nickel transport system substrate-binding protein|nr:ABC transporter substrate-binding protein [Gaiellales bacterium]